MTEKWANHNNAGAVDVFHALHAGLTVELISTKRPQLMTCALHEALPVVMARNTEAYDFLPVVAPGDRQQDRIIGLFDAVQFCDEVSVEGHIEQHYVPLSEEHLMGADASILEFVVDADKRPCRLVISRANIVGLVSLSDLQKLPVRAALFALITGFEISMFEVIKREYPNDDEWKRSLSDNRKKKINKEIEGSHRGDGFVDALLFTQFCDKLKILRKGFQLPKSEHSKGNFRDKLDEIQTLRDNLAHANEYAATRDQARQLCGVIRELLALRDTIAHMVRVDSEMVRAGATSKRGHG